jgi:hypothetical protein
MEVPEVDPSHYLQFNATAEDESSADIVIAFPFSESGEEDENEAKRRDMLARFTKAGLHYTTKLSEDKDEVFVIMDAPERRLMEAAEVGFLELRLKKQWDLPYAAFTFDRKDDFIHEREVEGKVFSTRDRQTLLMQIIQSGDFDSVEEMQPTFRDNQNWVNKYGTPKLPTCGLDLDAAISEGIIIGFWAMHGVNRRPMLLKEWGYSFFKTQPLDMINEYFNSKTALYFGFIGYYSMWLAGASILGVLVTIYSYGFEAPKHQSDNRWTMVYAFVMAFWGTLFLEYWTRYNAELAYRWSVIDLAREARERADFKRGCDDITRSGFYTHDGHFIPYGEDIDPHASECAKAMCCGIDICGSEPLIWAPEEEVLDEKTAEELNQVHPGEQAFMDNKVRGRRQMAMGAVALFFIVSVLAILMSFLVLRLIFMKMIGVGTGALAASIAQALCTVGLNVIYKEIAICMVDYENYRTDMEWENAIIKKVFPFQFINSYFSLFYIAFLKGKIGDLYGYNDQCKNSLGEHTESCMFELSTLLLSTLLTTQIAGTIAEALLPYFQYRAMLALEQAKAGDKELSTMTKEAKLVPCHPLDAFNDYNKMVLQFGYVSMFVAAFPLAPVCALLNNVLEIRTDAIKRLLSMQRPAPSQRAETIGEWMVVLEFMSMAAVATNVGVLCFTSDHLATAFKLSNSERVWAFIILEHVVVLIKLIIAYTIDDRPEWVSLRLARDEYMASAREEIIAKEQDEALLAAQESLLKDDGLRKRK